MHRSSSSSHLRSPADEVVSAVTGAQWPWPSSYAANGNQAAYPHPQSGLATQAVPVSPEARSRGALHDPHAVRHALAYHAQIPAGVPVRGGKTRYPDAPDVTLPSAAPTPATGRGIGGGIGMGKPAANASTTNADDGERRHCCPHCNKRFNRPSSLAIHVNTHTGAKRKCRSLLLPARRSTRGGERRMCILCLRLRLFAFFAAFTCAFPGCNRKFNVNSNMRRHYRNHLTARRRDAVARMVQPGPPTSAAGMSRVPSQLSPAMVPMSVSMAQAPVPMYPMHSSSSIQAANSNLLAPMHHPQSQPRAHTDATSSRSGSTPISGYGSGSRSPSRSGSYSPSVPSPSPSPLPSPISAVTSPFPLTPRSLPAPSFRPSSPARLHPGSAHGYAYYQPQAEKQPPHHHLHLHQERASPGWSADDYGDEDDEEIEDELDADSQGPLTATATATAQESYVRGERASSFSTSASGSASGSGSERRRPRAESSPESRRARPYPSPRARAHRLSSASASVSAMSDGGEGREGSNSNSKCEVPGCGCAAGRGAGARLRPAFQDHPRERELGSGHQNSNPGWTVLEDNSEDG